MDIRVYSLICVAYIAMLRTADAGCKEDKKADNDYKECLDAYNGYIMSVGQSGSSMTDVNQIKTLLCNEQGQAATSCMHKHFEECKELETADELSFINILKQTGGCGGGPQQPPASAECAAASKECLSIGGMGGGNPSMEGMGGGDPSMEGMAGDDPSISKAPTEFHMFQEQIKEICGMVKSKFDCLKKHEKTCPELENTFKMMMEQGMKASSPGTPVPSFDTQKKFTMEQCPKFPKDFTTSACIKDNLAKATFTDCYKSATEKYEKPLTCDAYKDAYPCVTTALESCGEKYTTAFMATTNFYLASTHKDCKIGKETSGGNVYFVSLYTIVIGFVLTYVF